MLLSNPVFSLTIFSLFLGVGVYWLSTQGKAHINSWLKEFKTSPRSKKLRQTLILLFLIMLVIVNVLPFTFPSYEEEEINYNYIFYQQGTLNQPSEWNATNMGGLYLIFPLIYRALDINHIQETMILRQAIMILMLPVGFLLIRQILRFFIPDNENQNSLATLLTLLYLSLPQTNQFIWASKAYYLSAHLFFLIAFASLLSYLKNKSTLQFIIYLLATTISVQTRPEFAAFATLLLAIHILSIIKFSKFKLKLEQQNTKEKTIIITNLIFIAFLIISTAIFMHNYGDIRISDNIKQIFEDRLKIELHFMFGLFNPTIIYLTALLCIAALIYHAKNRKYIILMLVFTCTLFTYIIPTRRFSPDIYTHHIYILLFCMLAYALDYITTNKLISADRVIISGSIILLIILANIYLIKSEQNLFITFDKESIYNRNSTLHDMQEASEIYAQMKGNNFLIFDKYGGKLYFPYVFKDTNNTFVKIDALKNLNTTSSNDTRRKLIFLKHWPQVCTQKEIVNYINNHYTHSEDTDSSLSESDYSTIIANIQNSEIKFYANMRNDNVLCEITSRIG